MFYLEIKNGTLSLIPLKHLLKNRLLTAFILINCIIIWEIDRLLFSKRFVAKHSVHNSISPFLYLNIYLFIL